MLAQAARKINLVPIVIDLFADQDTQAIAEKVVCIDALSLVKVQKVVLDLMTEYNIKSVLYGSGLEGNIDVLFWLEGLFLLHGNSAQVHQRYCNTQDFFKHLEQLNIPYPAISFDQPANAQCYLIKSAHNSGGVGLRSYDGSNLQIGEYYQQFQKGCAASVLFIAEKQCITIIGFHRQWTVSAIDFSFAGIIKQMNVPARISKAVRRWLEKLITVYALKGLGSLDFIWDGEQCYFLELNLRPPASMLLYPELNLLAAHMMQESLSKPAKSTVRALQIIYAKKDCRIENSLNWPEWSADRPQKSVRIKENQPICSIMADGKTVGQVEQQLQNRKNFIQNHVLNR